MIPFEIHTPRLVLRPLSRGDVQTTHQYAGDVGNTQYMLHLPNACMAQTERFLARVEQEWAKDTPSFYEFAITLAGMHIGAVSLSLGEDRRVGELGWILRRDHWGQGYATEAARALMSFAVDTLQITQLEASCDARNHASEAVMKKLGMRLASDAGTRRYPGQEQDVAELRYAWGSRQRMNAYADNRL